MRRTTIILAVVLAIAGCTRHYTLVEPERRTIADFYTVDPQIPWSRATSGHMEVWTVDGPNLAAVYFLNGVKDGDTLFRVRGDKQSIPRFRKYMTPTEIMELVVASLASSKVGAEPELDAIAGGRAIVRTDQIIATMVEAVGLRPINFGGHPGFRFDLAFRTGQGLKEAGFVVGTVFEDKLYLIIYTAARAHYYDKYKESVERLVSSIQVKA